MDVESENARLAALRGYGIVGTPPEPEFNEIVRLAQEACGSAGAAVALVEADRCWFKARVGIEASELPRDGAFCPSTLRTNGVFVVPDARLDSRFNRMPVVTEGGFCFYAGARLLTPGGYPIGTICVFDRQPRELTAEQIAALTSLAEGAMHLFEQRRTRKTAAPFGTQSPFTHAGPPAGARNLLVVDDDDAVRSFVCLATRKLGYDVVEAANGAEALSQMNKVPGRIGLVLTDINMPVMDGLKLIRELKKQSSPPAIAVMSGRFEAHINSALRAEGVTALLGKPFSRDELKLTLLQAQAPAR